MSALWSIFVVLVVVGALALWTQVAIANDHIQWLELRLLEHRRRFERQMARAHAARCRACRRKGRAQ